MGYVTVKSLFKETWEIATSEESTVSDVLERLAATDARLSAAALLHRGRKLKRTMRVADVIANSGDFLTVVVVKRPKGTIPATHSRPPLSSAAHGTGGSPSELGRGVARRDAEAQKQPLSGDCHAVKHVVGDGNSSFAGMGSKLEARGEGRGQSDDGPACLPFKRASSNGIDAQEDEAGPPPSREPEADRLFSELQSELRALRCPPTAAKEVTPESAPTYEVALPDTSVRSATPPMTTSGARQPRGGVRTRSENSGPCGTTASQHNKHLRALPLPLQLQRLMDIFGALSTVYGFMLNQNIQATWHNMREAMQKLLQELEHPINPCIADIRAMNRLAPAVVITRRQSSALEGHIELNGGSEEDALIIELGDMTASGQQFVRPSQVSVHGAGFDLNETGLGCSGSALSSQKFSKAAFRRLAAAFRAALTTAVAAALSRRGFTDALAEMLQKGMTGDATERAEEKAAGWPAGSAWEEVTLEEACEALDPAAADANAPHAAVVASWWRQLSGQNVAAGRSKGASGPSVCGHTQALGAEAFLEHLTSLPWYQGQICHVENLPERKARRVRIPRELGAPVAAALAARGISDLFTHQAAAVEAALAGTHVVVSTSTASGKSLCYNLPIMQAMTEDPLACALYLFPTKALAQDQLRALREQLTCGFGEAAPPVEVYDGDTPMVERGQTRDRARVLVSNPDMLHRSILPVHAQFARFLANLRYVVVDEGHYYGGIFGAHSALVLRRLRRVCERCYNCFPRFIVTSATMANPKSHAQELLGVTEVCLVQDDGAPRGSKSFVLWNPPLREAAQRRGAAEPRGGGSSAAPRAVKRRRTEENAACEGGADVREGGAKLVVPQLPTPAPPPARDGTSCSKAKHLLRLEAERAVAAVSEPPGRRANSSHQWFRRGSRESGRQTITPTLNGDLSRGQVLLKGASMALDVAALRDRVEARLKERADATEGDSQRQQLGAPDMAERRRSPFVEIATLVAECVQHNVRTLAFCMTRKLCELVVSYARDILRPRSPSLTELVAVYRSGYAAEERREIERKLLDGRLRVVCATNAMELGVDVGQLSATLHLGFPGSVASLWQQAGRAGRRGQHSLAIYVAFDGALDQYFMKHPRYLFGRPIEHNPVDARNAQLLRSHIVCAAAEEPLHLGRDDAFFGPGLAECAEWAVGEGLLAPRPEEQMMVQWRDDERRHHALCYVGKAQPYAADVSLRTIDPNRIVIINVADGGAVLEEVEECKAFWQVYPGAVYYHQGRSFLCLSLDLSKRVASVRPAEVKYYTKTSDILDVHVLGGSLAYPANTRTADCPFTSAVAAEAVVTVHWFQFHRIWMSTGKVFDTVPLHLPDMAYRTQAVYIRIPPSARQRCSEVGLPFQAGLHSASHALLNVTPLYLTCGPADLGTECGNSASSRYCPERLLIYDKHPDGMGLVQQLHPLMGVLLERALELVDACPCVGTHGCPSCVQHTQCDDYNAVLDKAAARVVLQTLLKEEVVPAAGEL